MSDKIKPGDLVQVIKPTVCCNHPGVIGMIFIAEDIGYKENLICLHCDQKKGAIYAILSPKGWGELSRCKKIDPPSEGDSLPTRADKEITA